jgi:hypothetical protein
MSWKSFAITTLIVCIYIAILIGTYTIFWFNQNILISWHYFTTNSLFIEQIEANVCGAITNYIIHLFIISIYLLEFLRLPDMQITTYVNYVFNNDRRPCLLNTLYFLFLL